MREGMEALFEAVRKACSAHNWSRGVELTRAGAVVGEQVRGDEMALRISTRGGMASPLVTLWPADADWACECNSRDEVCMHVAAAVIALRRAQQEGKILPAPQVALGRLRYCFTRSNNGLVLERAVVQQDTVQPLTGTLASMASTRAILASQADLQAEQALGTHRRGWLPRDVLSKLFKALTACPDVRLDDVPVHVIATPVGMRAYVDDHGTGFRLFVQPDPPITEVFANGIVLCGDTLRVLGESSLNKREMEELPEGRYFAPEAVGELLTEVLPSLRKRIPVEVRTRKLPQSVAERPRLVLDVAAEGEALTILPTLVYGQPPMARVDGERLTYLGGGTVPARDLLAEQQLVRDLQRTLQLLPGRKERLTGADAIQVATRLKTWRGEIRGHGHEKFWLVPALVPRLTLTATDFDVVFESNDTKTGQQETTRHADTTAVLRAWQAGESLVPLHEGGWAPLPTEWLLHYGHRVADLLAARDTRGRLPRSVLPDLARLCDALEAPCPPECIQFQTWLENFTGIPEAPLPADLAVTLRPYQQRGVHWLLFLQQAGMGAMLADDMGLGKTVQALCALQGRTLVVAPTSVIYHWAEELQRFRPQLRHSLYHGPQRQLDATADVTLTTYALLRLDAERLTQERWGTVILDEAQNIKNPDSQVARAAYRLRGQFRLTLSGTPIENRLDELWSQLHFLNRGLLGGRQHFQERYARPIAAGQAGALERLRERIRPFILRRRKSEVTPDLPPRTEVVLHCVLSEEERLVYDTIRAATLRDVVARLHAGGNIMEALEALLRLRQACCHIGLVPGQTATTSSKVETLLETLESVVANGHKALVFSQWTALLDRVEPHVRAAHIAFARLDGTTRDRAGVVRRFQEDAAVPIMLISLRAGGTGLNLTAADHIFLLDPWWNPAVEDQAADRAHRLGQTRPVLIHRMVARDTVEERIVDLQHHKRALADMALADAARAVSITREDVLALLT